VIDVNYVFGVVVWLVIICDRWIIYLLEIVGDNLVIMCNMLVLLWTMKYYDDWLFLLILFDYDWCEANPQWSVVDCLPICM